MKTHGLMEVTGETQRGRAASVQRSAFSGRSLLAGGVWFCGLTSGARNRCGLQRNGELVVQRHSAAEPQAVSDQLSAVSHRLLAVGVWLLALLAHGGRAKSSRPAKKRRISSTETQRGRAASVQRSAFSGQPLGWWRLVLRAHCGRAKSSQPAKKRRISSTEENPHFALSSFSLRSPPPLRSPVFFFVSSLRLCVSAVN